MSSMIRCDKCKKMMYADSRSNKGDWCTVRIDYVDGMSTLHLCKVCHRQFLVEFTRTMKPEEYDEQFGSWWEDEATECIERPKSLGFDRRPEWPFGGDET